MNYVNVVVIAPDDQEYDARIDAEASYETLIQDLVRGLKLDTVAEDGETPIRYGLNVLRGTRIEEGSAIQLYRLPQSSVSWIKQRKKR